MMIGIVLVWHSSGIELVLHERESKKRNKYVPGPFCIYCISSCQEGLCPCLFPCLGLGPGFCLYLCPGPCLSICWQPGCKPCGWDNRLVG